MYGKYFVAVLFLVGATALAARGQAPAAGQSGPEMQANLKSLVTGMPAQLPNGQNELKGSPYAIARWLPAHLVLSNNLPLATIPLKYDVLNQRLLMRSDFKARDSLQLDDQLVTRFTLDEPAAGDRPARTRTFLRFTDAPEPRARRAYVELLHQGRYALLKQYVKAVRRADAQNPYSTGTSFDEVEDKQLYFLRGPDGRVVPVKLTLKSLAVAAPDLAPALSRSPLPRLNEADWAAALAAADPR